MPPTVSVAAFVFGIVLLLAALIGKELKIVTMELPALSQSREKGVQPIYGAQTHS